MHLIFLVGVPQRMVTSYLVCVGALARVVKDKARRDVLMAAATAEEFVELMREGSLVVEEARARFPNLSSRAQSRDLLLCLAQRARKTQ